MPAPSVPSLIRSASAVRVHLLATSYQSSLGFVVALLCLSVADQL